MLHLLQKSFWPEKYASRTESRVVGFEFFFNGRKKNSKKFKFEFQRSDYLPTAPEWKINYKPSKLLFSLEQYSFCKLKWNDSPMYGESSCISLCFLYGIPYRILTNKKSISCTSKCYGSLMPDLYTVSLWTHKNSNLKWQLEFFFLRSFRATVLHPQFSCHYPLLELLGVLDATEIRFNSWKI